MKKSCLFAILLCVSLYLTGCVKDGVETVSTPTPLPDNMETQDKSGNQNMQPTVKVSKVEPSVNVPTGANTAEERVASAEVVLLKGTAERVFLFDLDGDGKQETIELSGIKEAEQQGYTLTVDGVSVTETKKSESTANEFYPTGNIYVCELSGRLTGTELLLEIDGYYDFCDYVILSYHKYSDGKKSLDIVASYSNSRSMPLIHSDRGTFSLLRRGDCLDSFYSRQEYCIAQKTADNRNFYVMTKVPAGLLPVGIIHELKTDLVLQKSRFEEEETIIIKAGENVVFSAYDNMEWIYVAGCAPDDEGEYLEGWLKFENDKCRMKGEWFCASDVFVDLSAAE